MEDEKLWQRMLSGKMYNDLSSELMRKRNDVVLLTNRYNRSYGEAQRVRESILREILGGMGENVNFEPDFRCEFGSNIFNNVLFGPRVGLYAGNHAIHPEDRVAGGCYSKPITIGDNVWVGAGVHIMGGVTIGRNSIIGAGSVVTKDIPENVIAAGVPCRMIREITEEDRNPDF